MLKTILEKLISVTERRNYRSQAGSTLIHIAAETDAVDNVADFVYKDGFDVNILNSDSETPLIVAIRNDSTHAAEFLIKQGCDLNILTNLNDSALLWAAYKGNVYIFNMMVHYGANVHHVYHDGRDVFLWAVHKNRIEMVNYMLENIDININILDHSDRGWFQTCKTIEMMELILGHIQRIKLYFYAWLAGRPTDRLDILILKLLGEYIYK